MRLVQLAEMLRFILVAHMGMSFVILALGGQAAFFIRLRIQGGPLQPKSKRGPRQISTNLFDLIPNQRQ